MKKELKERFVSEVNIYVFDSNAYTFYGSFPINDVVIRSQFLILDNGQTYFNFNSMTRMEFDSGVSLYFM